MKKLRPSTNYSFTREDLDFVLELAKVASVHLLSNQVSLMKRANYDENASLTFNDTREKCFGLQLPENWFIEWIGFSKGCLNMTFAVRNKNT